MCVSETLFFIVFSKCLFGPVLCTLSFPNNFSRPFSKKLAILDLFDGFLRKNNFPKKLFDLGFYGEAS